jgi:hypothetical protein
MSYNNERATKCCYTPALSLSHKRALAICHFSLTKQEVSDRFLGQLQTNRRLPAKLSRDLSSLLSSYM